LQRVHPGLRSTDLGDHEVADRDIGTRRVVGVPDTSRRETEEQQSSAHRAIVAQVDGELPGFATLEDVLAYGLPRRWDVVEVVVQDEFTHDVIVTTPSRFLVFDTT
jgi:hypothetical protein